MNPEIYDYTKEQLIHYLRHEAGSSNPDYFKAVKPGGMKLQQVPDEYSSLLLFLKERKIESYLALGVGNGGSFAMECFFMKESLRLAVAVDNLAYGELIGQNRNEILEFIKPLQEKNKQPYIHGGLPMENKIYFSEETTDEFFKRVNTFPSFFDAVFIDADHNYIPAKKDYLNAMNHVYKGSIIIFHDINSKACPGIVRLWNEVKKNHVKHWEFVHSDTCGIGVVEC